MRGSRVLKFSGVCGVLAPIIAFTFIFLAMSYFPGFDWSKNALSDLAGEEASELSALFFNSGLIISGVLTLIFAVGLKHILPSRLDSTLGIYVFVADAVALSLIGVFPETAGRIHFYVSLAFFMLFPVAVLLISSSMLRSGQSKGLGLFTAMDGLVSIVVWLVPYGGGLAIPETLASLTAAVWSLVLGLKMLME